MILQSLIGAIFILPVLALIIHLVIPNSVNIMRFYVQTLLILTWLLLALILLCGQKMNVITIGSWPASFGITLISDHLSNLMLLVFAIVASCINFYSYQDQQIIKKTRAFYAGFWLLLLGVSGAIFTADIFNLYVWFEVMLVSAFILLASSQKPKIQAIINYAIINIIGTLLMLLAVALLYGVFGTLSYAGIAEKLSHSTSAWTLPILCIFLLALGLKGALFPLYFWLPKAYPKTSASSTMLLSSLMTKVVMLILLRLIWLWSILHDTFVSNSLLFIALATMFFGVVGAASQFRFKGILAFHIISQLGYVVLAMVLTLPAAIIAAVYFLIHNIFVKTNLFMVASILAQQIGSDDLKKLGEVLKHYKWLAITFFLSAMSLAGFPPLSGFWGKFLVIKALLTEHFYVSAAIAIFVSLLTLYSMIKIWRYVFCEHGKIEKSTPWQALEFSWCLSFAILPLLVLPILMGIWPDSLLLYLNTIANQLSEPQHYVYLLASST